MVEVLCFHDIDSEGSGVFEKGRRNIGDNQLNVLIEKAYNRQKAKRGGDYGNQYTVEAIRQPDEKPKATVEVVGEAYGVSPKTVERAAQFVEVLGEIEKKTSPEVVQQIVTLPEDRTARFHQSGKPLVLLFDAERSIIRD